MCDLREEILRGLRDLCREPGSWLEFEDICIPWNLGSFLCGNHQDVESINCDFRRSLKQAMNQNKMKFSASRQQFIEALSQYIGENSDICNEVMMGQ